MIQRLLGFSVVGVLLFCSIIPAQAETGAASRVIEQLNTTLLDVMKQADKLGYQGRRSQLDPVIRQSHNLPFLARFSLGRQWKQLTAEQQAEWVALFSDYSVATYAERFNGYDGETFEVTGERPMRGDKMVVESLLTIPGAENHQFEYILQQNKSGAWQIVNVVVDGVSDLALKRAEYSAIIKKNRRSGKDGTHGQSGFTRLISELSNKIASYGKK